MERGTFDIRKRGGRDFPTTTRPPPYFPPRPTMRPSFAFFGWGRKRGSASAVAILKWPLCDTQGPKVPAFNIAPTHRDAERRPSVTNAHREGAETCLRRLGNRCTKSILICRRLFGHFLELQKITGLRVFPSRRKLPSPPT